MTTFLFCLLAVLSPGEVVLDIAPSAENPRNSEGDFVTLKDGRILFVYTHFVGGGGDHDAAKLMSRISEDGGATWSGDDQLVVDNEGGMNVMSVSLLRLQSGDIALFYLRKNSTNDCRLHMRRSADEGKTWSEATVCTDPVAYYVVNNDRVLQLESGRLLVPASQHDWEGDAKGWHRGVAMVFYSDDEGRRWQRGPSRLEAPEQSRSGLQEPGIVPLADGRLWLFARTDQGVQFQSFSEDHGESWSPAEASTIHSPVSPATIERVPGTTDLLMVWNDHTEIAPDLKGKRTPLTLGRSTDDGKSWQTTTLEEEADGWYCYTAMHFVDGHVLLGYCAGNKEIGGLNRTRIRRLPLELVPDVE